jgi:hypothetical protein
MRLFQNGGIYASYRLRLGDLAAKELTFDGRRQKFLQDRFGAIHFLKPILESESSAFFTNGDDRILQKRWAREKGMSRRSSLEEILLAQIEEHRTEVFYNLHPVLYGTSFANRLPVSVKVRLCWLASPAPGIDLSGYDRILNNFPSLLNGWRTRGFPSEYFAPAVDPEMRSYGWVERPIDLLFVGGYSQYHLKRAKVLERVAELAETNNVVYCLDASRLTRLAEGPLGILSPLKKFRRPKGIRSIAKPPVFGRSLYELLGRAKIVLNGAIDMAGSDRGNMRCFEAMGCGALLLSDDGLYPEGMLAGETIVTYDGPDRALDQARRCLSDWGTASRMAALGRERIENMYSKSKQWQHFERIVSSI